mgnify:CR=1 FL=1
MELPKNAFSSAVASTGESPPTSTWPPTVTPAGIVAGRGVVGVVVVVVVVVGGGGAVVVVPVVVPSWASADGVPTSSPAVSRPAAEQPTSSANENPRLTAAV